MGDVIVRLEEERRPFENLVSVLNPSCKKETRIFSPPGKHYYLFLIPREILKGLPFFL